MYTDRPWWKIWVAPNRQRQPSPPAFITIGGTCRVAVIEYDDQGRCYDLGKPATQLGLIRSELKTYEGKDAVIIVFVHGWKHNGESSDSNLKSFTATIRAIRETTSEDIPVLGIFVAWRGLSEYGLGIFEELTFYGRKRAALRVAMGAPRELFAYLRQYRRERLHQGGHPILVVAGHSFGGLVTFAALGQSLIEAAATQCGRVVPSFADLVILINPAFEALRYLPIHDIMSSPSAGPFILDQPPVFVSVTAYNDWATGLAFPAGMWFARWHECTRGYEEKQSLTNTMGHLDWMRTHDLSRKSPSESDPAVPIGPTFLRRTASSMTKPQTPFWVVGATKDVIDGHNGIWDHAFEQFLFQLVSMHISTTAARRV